MLLLIKIVLSYMTKYLDFQGITHSSLSLPCVRPKIIFSIAEDTVGLHRIFR